MCVLTDKYIVKHFGAIVNKKYNLTHFIIGNFQQKKILFLPWNDSKIHIA